MGVLTAGDYVEWVAAFNDAFSNSDALDNVVKNTRGLTLEQVVGKGPLLDIVPALIKRADDEGWAPDLARKAFEARPRNPKLKRVVDRIEIRVILEGDDPYLAIRMQGQPMLDRATLRATIRAVENDEAPRVFVIGGERLSGKTYTIQFLTYVSRKRGSFRVIPVDLERHLKAAAAAIPADRIARSIVSSAGLPGADLETMPQMAEEQEARFSLEFSEWLVGVLDRAAVRHCIVFDHFSKALLTQGSSDLVIELCNRAFQSRNLVIVLLEYDRVGDLEAAVGKIVDHTMIERIDPATLVQDLTRFFVAVHAERQQLGGGLPTDATKELAKVATQNVLRQVMDGEDRLLKLRTAIAEELRRDTSLVAVPGDD
jgi:hypothetical protein